MNYRMPAEWEPHAATWLAWPHDIITFPDRVPQVEKTFADIIHHLHTGERVELFVLDKTMQERASTLLKERGVDLAAVNFHIMDYADVWSRDDTTPTFVLDKNTGQQILIKWQYSAYGHKFPPLLKDGAKGDEVAKYLNRPLETINIFGEGGAVETNGQGLLLTTEECLLNPNRNLNKTKSEIESELKKYLGAEKIVWLAKGLVNDHTDGHIDELARFVSPTKLVCAYEDDKTSPNYKIIQANYQILKDVAEVVKLPMPHFHYDGGELAPASYANFYIANQVVLVPQFNDPNDTAAVKIIQSLFPDRQAIGIDCTDLIYGGGVIHCVTREQPLKT